MDGPYKTLFAAADSEELGVLTGEVAVTFFARSNLPTAVLGEIWQIADKDNNGFLTPDRHAVRPIPESSEADFRYLSSFEVAAKLIGHAQAGTTVTPELEGKG